MQYNQWQNGLSLIISHHFIPGGDASSSGFYPLRAFTVRNYKNLAKPSNGQMRTALEKVAPELKTEEKRYLGKEEEIARKFGLR